MFTKTWMKTLALSGAAASMNGCKLSETGLPPEQVPLAIREHDQIASSSQGPSPIVLESPQSDQGELTFFASSWIASDYRTGAGKRLDDSPNAQFLTVIGKDFDFGTLKLTLFGNIPTTPAGSKEIDVNVGFEKSFYKDFSVRISSENFFFPDEDIASIHELRLKAIYSGLWAPVSLQLVQNVSGSEYSYANLSCEKSLDLGRGFSFTPSLQLTTILNGGDTFTSEGLAAIRVGGQLEWQGQRSWPAFFIAADQWIGLNEDVETGPSLRAGISFSF